MIFGSHIFDRATSRLQQFVPAHFWAFCNASRMTALAKTHSTVFLLFLPLWAFVEHPSSVKSSCCAPHPHLVLVGVYVWTCVHNLGDNTLKSIALCLNMDTTFKALRVPVRLVLTEQIAKNAYINLSMPMRVLRTLEQSCSPMVNMCQARLKFLHSAPDFSSSWLFDVKYSTTMRRQCSSESLLGCLLPTKHVFFLSRDNKNVF